MQSLIPDPLHPAIVHFPIVFMTLFPLALIGAWWAIRRGTAPNRAWLLPVATAAALAASAWAALETGEQDEERAEKVVGEQLLEQHEEAAELFLTLAIGGLVLTAAGLARGPVGKVARVASGVAAVVLVLAGYRVGHSGGQVAYGNGVTSGLSRVNGATAESEESESAIDERGETE